MYNGLLLVGTVVLKDVSYQKSFARVQNNTYHEHFNMYKMGKVPNGIFVHILGEWQNLSMLLFKHFAIYFIFMVKDNSSSHEQMVG